MRRRIIRQSGFTLIELLMYVTIVGSLMLSLTYLFANAADARLKNQSITEVNDQATAMMDRMTQTIRNATSITSPAGGASASSLTLVVPTGALSPTVFNLNSTTLQMTEGAGAAVALNNNKVQVTSLTFKNLSRTGTIGLIQVSFTLSRVNNNTHSEYDYTKTFTSSAEIIW